MYIFHRYYALSNEYKFKGNQKLREVYYPFVRPDLDNIHILWSMPFYLTWLPRFVAAWSVAFFAGAVCFIFGKGD